MASEDSNQLTRAAGQISVSKQEMFSFQDLSYHTGFTTRLVTMRQENLLTDISLKAGDVTIPCHKVALAAASQYFYRRINLEQVPLVLELHNIHPEVLEVIIDFIYTAEVEISADLVKELSMSCDQLELLSLKQACDDYIAAKVVPANALGLYMFSTKYHLEKTKFAAKKCMVNRAEDIQRLSLDVEYESLSQDALIEWISDDCLEVNKEDTVFMILEKWVKANPARNIEESLDTILAKVRLPLCSADFLVDHVQDSPLLEHKKCQKYLKEAMKFMVKKEKMQSDRTRSRIGGGPKHVLIGGLSNGVANNQCWYKGVDSQVWTEMTTLPSGQVKHPYGFRAVVVDDGFVITGGGTRAGWGSCTSDAWYYDMLSRSWQELPPMKQARSEHGMVAVANLVFVIGGLASRPETSVEKLDVSSKQWTNMAPLPHIVWFCHAALIHGDIYLVSGSERKTQKYSIAADAWQVLTDPPQQITYTSMASLDEFIYVVGGEADDQNMCYNTTTDTWALLPAPAQPRAFGSALEHHGKVVLCGGADHLKKCKLSVEEYDPESKKWSVSELVLPKPLGGHRMITM